MNLRYEELQRQYDKISSLNDLLINDILSELDQVKDGNQMLIGTDFYTANDLRDEVESKSEIGLELIRLHHKLNRKLRGRE
jgi:hypothetical protein